MASKIDALLEELSGAAERPWWLTKGSDPVKKADEEAAITGPDWEVSDPQGLAKEIREGRENPVTSKPEASLRGAYSQLPFMDEGTAALKAFGESKDIRNLPEAYRRARDEERVRTERASQEHPDTFYPAAGATLLASSFTPGGAVRAAKTAKEAAKAGAVAGGIRGAVDAAGRSEADLTKGEVGDFAKDVAIGTGVAATLGGAMAGGAHKLTRGAEERAQKAIVRQATEGADPTHARRLSGREGESAPGVVAFVRKHKEVSKALGDQKEVSRVTDAIASKAGKETAPIYDELDEVAGRVPVREVVQYLDTAIGNYAQRAGDENFADALTQARQNVVRATRARGEDIETATWKHRELRDWVTRLLKDEQRTVGSISETRAYEIKDTVHGVADDFLRGTLDEAAHLNPKLTPKVEKLRELNRDISTALRMNQAADNAGARAYYANQNPLLNAIAGGATGTVLGSGAGAGAAVTAYAGTVVAPKAAKVTGRAINKAVAGLVQKAENGSLTAKAVQAAIEEGVPVSVARGVAAVAQKKFGKQRDKPQDTKADDLDWGDDDGGALQWE